ncbi:hypothetical protein TRFO_34196 [Tritrichomonas foetus]|uniref:Tubby C-terminal domain-containing protein n=1 Tax=Tritrichomonas foetus TaxID=1144522 RepID=A0A1J4JL02_9EUKA|nr:hypothetical protein TRFO_34196 [Tritrichomonas foetus]|eukprot:OHS99345.1 hypothetical protein TRFO_34196 [Tritrichomonas foetus]
MSKSFMLQTFFGEYVYNLIFQRILMSKTIVYEPYLCDYDVVFHDIFTLIDPAMNTSEIKPLHLAVPRNTKGIKGPSASSLSQTRNENQNKGSASPSEKTSGTQSRFLSQRYLTGANKAGSNNTSKPSIAKEVITQNVDKILPQEEKPAETKTRITKEVVNVQSSPPPPQQQREQPHEQERPPPNPAKVTQSRSSAQLAPQDNKVITDILMRNEDYWLLPLSPSTGVRFKFIVDGNSGPGFIFKLLHEVDLTLLMEAKMNGASRSSGVHIFVNGKNVGETNYTPGNSAFYVGVDAGREERSECCAAVFNPSFSSANQPRIFDFLVPGLKKIQGKSRMFPIVFSEPSGLVTRLSQLSKEAIRLKTRVPVSQGNSFDMTFDGKFQHQSLSNFVMYHDSNTRKDLCSLGMYGDNEYYLEIGYPLSPLQGFMAAVAATIPV